MSVSRQLDAETCSCFYLWEGIPFEIKWACLEIGNTKNCPVSFDFSFKPLKKVCPKQQQQQGRSKMGCPCFFPMATGGFGKHRGMHFELANHQNGRQTYLVQEPRIHLWRFRMSQQKRGPRTVGGSEVVRKLSSLCNLLCFLSWAP